MFVMYKVNYDFDDKFQSVLKHYVFYVKNWDISYRTKGTKGIIKKEGLTIIPVDLI